MVRVIVLVFLVNLCSSIKAQNNDIDIKEQDLSEVKIDLNYKQKYKQQLYLLRKTYPLALRAKELIDEYEDELNGINVKRKQKKYTKKAHQELKDEFAYNIKNLYTNEGDLLLKLIHRETGMTVDEIIQKYRGNLQTGLYTAMGKLWGHELDVQYAPQGDDWITEIVISDILSGRLEFDFSVKKMEKGEYKESMADYRENMKDYRKEKRSAKKAPR